MIGKGGRCVYMQIGKRTLPCCHISLPVRTAYGVSPYRRSSFQTSSLGGLSHVHNSGYMGDAYHNKIMVQSILGATRIIPLDLEKRRCRSSSTGNQSSLWKWGRLLKKIQICFPFGRNWSYPKRSQAGTFMFQEVDNTEKSDILVILANLSRDG